MSLTVKHASDEENCKTESSGEKRLFFSEANIKTTEKKKTKYKPQTNDKTRKIRTQLHSKHMSVVTKRVGAGWSERERCTTRETRQKLCKDILTYRQRKFPLGPPDFS